MVKFRFNNPGGQWLENKKRQAIKSAFNSTSLSTKNKLEGAITCFASDVWLPVLVLKDLKGANGEEPGPGKVKYDRLMRSVKKNSWNHDQIQDDGYRNSAIIRINQAGSAFICEGNNRISIAAELCITTLRCELHWMNGGEEIDGFFSPLKVSKLAMPDPRNQRDYPSIVSGAVGELRK
jgi:hypothetical protein